MVCKYFFHSVGCRIPLLIVSFDVEKFLILMKSNFFYFFLFCWCLWCHFQLIMLESNVMKFSPMFSMKSFIVLALKFRSLIHFEVIFVYGVRWGPNFFFFFFFFLHMDMQFFQPQFVEKAVLGPHVKNHLTLYTWLLA